MIFSKAGQILSLGACNSRFQQMARGILLVVFLFGISLQADEPDMTPPERAGWTEVTAISSPCLYTGERMFRFSASWLIGPEGQIVGSRRHRREKDDVRQAFYVQKLDFKNHCTQADPAECETPDAIEGRFIYRRYQRDEFGDWGMQNQFSLPFATEQALPVPGAAFSYSSSCQNPTEKDDWVFFTFRGLWGPLD